ncbi:RIP metalloprotease RseP [Pseudooceanicola sp.]|uniref:RIP metalloprotease RseP n=1 Tax=Pseudooceanicola sp. TaxID=1914328 RepID=UPI004058D62F|tara:strand:- start:5107 stop:6447 length:1341 start_codon:yes stop_codon:yes gene_type:complete
MDFLPQFGSIFQTLVAFVVALSIIVAIHEYGHYIIGRLSGIRAEVFSLGFGPVLFARTDKHGTRWQLAALPFGGYVKFLGDSDAASGKDDTALSTLPEEDRRMTMHGAPLWARTATVAAGPVFNFILSTLIFAGLFMMQGDIARPLAVAEMRPLPAAYGALEPGDRVLAIAGFTLPEDETGSFDGFEESVPRDAVVDYRVLRNEREQIVDGPYPYPPLITQLAPNSAAYDIGLKSGDVIQTVEGAEIVSFAELKEVVEASDGRALALTVWREGVDGPLDFTLAPRRVDEPRPEGGFSTQWRIGIAGGMAFEPATESKGVVSAISDGGVQTWRIVESSVSGLWHMITGAISTCNMTGPIGIAQTSGAMASQGAVSFIWFVAALSTAVGLLNLFPIPVLDGGHLVFFAYEAVVGRPPSDKALKVLMGAGLTLILGVMLFALTNDVLCP